MIVEGLQDCKKSTHRLLHVFYQVHFKLDITWTLPSESVLYTGIGTTNI
jgi:hypothetical protein